MPNPFQIDMDIHTDIPKTKTPNTFQNIDKIDHLQTQFSQKTVQNSSNHSAGNLVAAVVKSGHTPIGGAVLRPCSFFEEFVVVESSFFEPGELSFFEPWELAFFEPGDSLMARFVLVLLLVL